MYSEKTFKNYIFWLQVKRIVVIIILTSIGAALGVLIGKILESTIQLTSFSNEIIIGSSVVFFLLSLLLTVGTGRRVQDGYWKIAVLRKLTVIQKDIELNNELLKKADVSVKEKLKPVTSIVPEISNKEIKTETEETIKEEIKNDISVQEENEQEVVEVEEEEVDNNSIYKFDETALITQKNKSKFSKKIKMPDLLK